MFVLLLYFSIKLNNIKFFEEKNEEKSYYNENQNLSYPQNFSTPEYNLDEYDVYDGDIVNPYKVKSVMDGNGTLKKTAIKKRYDYNVSSSNYDMNFFGKVNVDDKGGFGTLSDENGIEYDVEVKWISNGKLEGYIHEYGYLELDIE